MTDKEPEAQLKDSVRVNVLGKQLPNRHKIASRFASGSAFKEDARRVDNGIQVRRVAELASNRGPSIDFVGYCQRHIKAA